jgi:hypothetical protein
MVVMGVALSQIDEAVRQVIQDSNRIFILQQKI